MKVAIVHDELLRKGGAERVVISLHKLYPTADIFTIAYRPDSTYEYFKKCVVKTTFLNALVSSEKWLMALFFPFGFWAMRSLDLKEYDLIILSSAHGAQYIKKPKGSKVINYAHYVFRLIWEPESYDFLTSSWARIITYPVFKCLRFFDKVFNVQSDFIIFNSSKTKKKYCEVFTNLSADRLDVINPPVDLSGFHTSSTQGDFFLVVSRFEPYKKVDLVITTFREIDKKLIIVGSGTMEDELREMAKDASNISFEIGVTDARLKELYSNCNALIFPQVEDFGITPLECNASGRPIIAFAKGGVLETMVEDKTAVFFREQTLESLGQAIQRFANTEFSQEAIVANAGRFDEPRFHDKIKSVIENINLPKT